MNYLIKDCVWTNEHNILYNFLCFAQTGIPGFFVVPGAMEKIVDYIKIRYHNMPMYITENGA